MTYTNLRLRASFQGERAERKFFSASRCQLTISVGQKSHEGDRFLSTIELINRSFAECVIMLDDSLQWYSLMIACAGKKKEDAIKEAIQLGDEWLYRNEYVYSQLTIPYQIVRWNKWLNSSQLRDSIQRMEEDYHSNSIVQKAIHETAIEYLSRQNQNNGLSLSERAISLCIDYLIEECAVMRDFWVENNAHYEVYPNKRSLAMATIYELFIAPLNPHLLKPVWLRFNTRHSKDLLNQKDIIENEKGNIVFA